jgi:3-hydroxyisobutyrate dehydrogenase
MTVTHTHPETVAVLGAGGAMGFPIARNIARAGIPVRAWHRPPDEAAPLARDGVRIADTPADAARGAGIVITMLDDGAAVAEAMDGPDGALAAMPGANQENGNRTDEPNGPPHALWVQMSTIGQEATKRCAELANRVGVGFVDAPVLGTRQPAEQRRLIVLESGPEEARPRTQPVFDAIADRTVWAGQAGAGSRLKLLIETRSDLDPSDSLSAL